MAGRQGERASASRWCAATPASHWLYRTSAAPPATPTPACAFTGPTRKFQNPTWAPNGQALAWQEDDGIWSAQVPDLTNCATISQPHVIVGGATEPSLGPAALAPGPRPPCGNPGNPTTCPEPTPTPTPGPKTDVTKQLHALLAAFTRSLKRLSIHGLLHKRRLTVASTAPAPGMLTATLSTRGRHPSVLAGGRVRFASAGKRTLTLTLAGARAALLRHARHLSCMLTVRFTPAIGAASSARGGVSLAK